MERGKYLVFLVLFAGFLGCTPQGDNIIKKEKPGFGAEEAVIGRGSSVDDNFALNSSLDPATRNIITSYGPTIRKYANKYGFDWRLILAIMKQESRFSHEAESEKGASGLMQIMPLTEAEVAKVLEIEDMTQPMNNIRGGIFYLKRLYSLFEGVRESDRIKLTLAAYNAGIGRVYDAQELAAYMHDNPNSWQAIKDALPLLSKRYYTLHRSVWESDKPRNGWFGNAKETVSYVDKIMDYYDEYRGSLN